MESNDARADTAALTRFSNANNMTDRMSGLAALVLKGRAHANGVLDTFYDRFKSEPDVIDKWFSIQAQVSPGDTLSKVRELIKHPDFDIANPNRARALKEPDAGNGPAHKADCRPWSLT